jgi:hypothetical protein
MSRLYCGRGIYAFGMVVKTHPAHHLCAVPCNDRLEEYLAAKLFKSNFVSAQFYNVSQHLEKRVLVSRSRKQI